MKHRLYPALYVVAVFALATGCFATVAALAWLPTPCTCHRKDGQ